MLTEFQPKWRHLDLVPARFHDLRADFSFFFALCSCVVDLYLCVEHTAGVEVLLFVCLSALHICVRRTRTVVLQPCEPAWETHSLSCSLYSRVEDAQAGLQPPLICSQDGQVGLWAAGRRAAAR